MYARTLLAAASSARDDEMNDEPAPQVLYLYMMTNRLEGMQTSTKIGCVSDVEQRMSQHNSTEPVAGAERRVRKAAGHWKPLLIIAVPRSSGLSARALANEWSQGTRRIHCRFEYGVERIARLPRRDRGVRGLAVERKIGRHGGVMGQAVDGVELAGDVTQMAKYFLSTTRSLLGSQFICGSAYF